MASSRQMVLVVVLMGALLAGTVAMVGLTVERGDVAVRVSGSAPAPPVSTPPVPGLRVEQHPGDPQARWLHFQSEAIGREVRTRIWLPDSYDEHGTALPVLYFLHGTASDPQSEFINDVPGCGEGCRPAASIEDQDPEVGFVVVSPDAGNPYWCARCWWVDGRNEMGVDAETHLYEELIPAVEYAFNVRTDRGGRGLAGRSMGANAALLHGFWHPDVWRFVVGQSATLVGLEPPGPTATNTTSMWLGYLEPQGYRPYQQDEVWYANLEPAELTQNIQGSGTEVMLSIGDGCIPPNSEGACDGDVDPQEAIWRRAIDMWSEVMTERGADFTLIRREGRHATGHQDTYRRFFGPRIEQLWDEPPPAPETFSFRRADTAFSVWGWDVAVERPTDEFLHLTGARTDGTAVTLAGTGLVTLTTPPLPVGPIQSLEVRATPDGADTATVLPADVVDGNRLRFTVDLGARDPAVNQQSALVDHGQFLFPRTRIVIEDAGT